jgi:hypothetical protein
VRISDTTVNRIRRIDLKLLICMSNQTTLFRSIHDNQPLLPILRDLWALQADVINPEGSQRTLDLNGRNCSSQSLWCRMGLLASNALARSCKPLFFHSVQSNCSLVMNFLAAASSQSSECPECHGQGRPRCYILHFRLTAWRAASSFESHSHSTWNAWLSHP